jgi:hypothetical protein
MPRAFLLACSIVYRDIVLFSAHGNKNALKPHYIHGSFFGLCCHECTFTISHAEILISMTISFP